MGSTFARRHKYLLISRDRSGGLWGLLNDRHGREMGTLQLGEREHYDLAMVTQPSVSDEKAVAIVTSSVCLWNLSAKSLI